MAQIPNFKGIKPLIKPVVNPAATRGGDSLFGGYGSERAAPPAAPAAPTMSDKHITRYMRDEIENVVAPVKTVAPVKKVVKPATSFKKVKAM